MRQNATPERRVVITGLGVIAPIGTGVAAFWPALLAGTCGVDRIKSFDTTPYKVHVGCEVKDFCYADFGLAPDPANLGKAAQFALAAAKMALDDARWMENTVDPNRIGVALGTTGGEIQNLETICQQLVAGTDKAEIERRLVSQFPCHRIAASVAAAFKLRGPALIFPNACAAGNYALAYAYQLIKANRLDLAVAGGVDVLSQMAFTGFYRLKSVAPDLCRPFDKHRKGIVLGEGAGVLVLESLESAMQRGVPIYAELAGTGLSCDAYHPAISDPDGVGFVLAMQRALQSAGINPEAVDYISAHGTGTPNNDKMETLAIKKLFGGHARNLLVSSIKGMIGHTFGAASALESIVCALAVKHDMVPPTINFTQPDPECDLNYVLHHKVARTINVALNNAFAFGGSNSSLVIRKFNQLEKKLGEVV